MKEPWLPNRRPPKPKELTAKVNEVPADEIRASFKQDRDDVSRKSGVSQSHKSSTYNRRKEDEKQSQYSRKDGERSSQYRRNHDNDIGDLYRKTQETRSSKSGRYNQDMNMYDKSYGVNQEADKTMNKHDIHNAEMRKRSSQQIEDQRSVSRYSRARSQNIRQSDDQSYRREQEMINEIKRNSSRRSNNYSRSERIISNQSAHSYSQVPKKVSTRDMDCVTPRSNRSARPVDHMICDVCINQY